MTTKFSYTVDATSNLVERLSSALKEEKRVIDMARLSRLQEVQKKVESLKERGLLNRQEYVSVTTSEFERRYYTSKTV